MEATDFLRQVPLFSGLSESDMDQLAQIAVPVDVPAGGVLMKEGVPGDVLYIVMEGEFTVFKQGEQQEIGLATSKSGDILGEIAPLTTGARSATVRAAQDSRVLMISDRAFQQVLARNPSVVRSVLATVAARLRNMEEIMCQHEKMAALGTLTAGLAHELNNPAAAVGRGATQLQEILPAWQRTSAALDPLCPTPPQVERLHTLREEMERRATTPAVLDPLERMDREGEVQAWLECHAVERPWDLSPVLVSFGWGMNALDEIAATFEAPQVPVIAAWLGLGCTIHSLLGEINQGAERIAEIIKAVKTYSYLDQGPIQQVDIVEGLENTLIILRHKLKNGITVRREYAPDLPRIEAYGSELNQVWTNLMDNAIDAMSGQGELTLRAYAEAERVVVEICDNGPGIPPEVQARIFEPFFTTKPQGVGTGLGLHIIYTTITEKHHGQITVTSQPGATCFQVRLPRNLSA
jgi:signal transduction histidine kinase